MHTYIINVLEVLAFALNGPEHLLHHIYAFLDMAQQPPQLCVDTMCVRVYVCVCMWVGVYGV